MSLEKISNYEKTRDAMEKRFLEYDQEQIIRKFGLACDERYFYIPFVGREYRLDRTNLLGRRVKRSVYDEHGEPVALAGERITPEVIARARRGNRLLALTVNTLTNLY